MFVSIKRIIRSGWISFSRNSWLATATIFIMVMVISLVTSLYLFRGMSDFIIKELEAKVDLSVYFKKDVLEGEILRAKEELSKLAEVKEVEYISSEQALENFKERHKDNPIILETLTEIGNNPLPASLDIKVFEAPQYENLVSYLQGSSFQSLIEKIDYQEKKPVIEKLFSVTTGLNTGGIIFSLILAFLAVLVAFNTIRLAIYNSRDEISVQRLVGASNWFIRGPYIFQGAVSGFFATLITLLIFAILCFFLGPKLGAFYPGLNLFSYFVSNFWTLFLIQFLTGVGLGIVSSVIAIRKYLQDRVNIPGSSNGRTMDSGSINLRSNRRPGAIMRKNKIITICCSASFYKQLFEIERKLKDLGFKVKIPLTANKMKKKNDFKVKNYKTWFRNPSDYKIKTKLMKHHFKKVIDGDAILVLNYKKKGIEGYIGGNVLMEMAVAFQNKKPIYILNPISDNLNIKEEVFGLQPNFLKGNINKISLNS